MINSSDKAIKHSDLNAKLIATRRPPVVTSNVQNENSTDPFWNVSLVYSKRAQENDAINKKNGTKNLIHRLNDKSDNKNVTLIINSK